MADSSPLHWQVENFTLPFNKKRGTRMSLEFQDADTNIKIKAVAFDEKVKWWIVT
jgi:hypothetical protein